MNPEDASLHAYSRGTELYSDKGKDRLHRRIKGGGSLNGGNATSNGGSE